MLNWWHGTKLDADVMGGVRGEMEKHDVQERTGKAMDDMGETKRESKEGQGKEMNVRWGE